MDYSRKFPAPQSRRWQRGALTVAVLGLTSLARAHPQYTAATINRYARLVLQPGGQVRLTYTLMVGDQPALALRQRADQDHDGRVDPAEAQRLAGALLLEIRPRLGLTLDEQPVALAFAEPQLGLAGERVAPAALSMDVSAVVRAPPGARHTLRLTDQANLPPVGEQEVLIDPGPGLAVLATHQGRAPARAPEAPVLRFVSNGPPRSSLADRSVTVVFLEERAAPAPPGRALWRASLLLAGGLALLLWWLRGRARRGGAASGR